MSKKVCKVKQGLLFLCCMVAATGCKQAPPAQMETEYEVMTVSPADRMISSAYSATIRGRQDIDIYPQVSGTLTKVCVTEGQRVKNGQTLFIIDQVSGLLTTATIILVWLAFARLFRPTVADYLLALLPISVR